MIRWFVWLALVMTGHGTAAQETLYGRQPPPGSSYVRLVNALPTAVTVSTNFQPDMRLGNGQADRVSQYGVVEHVASRTLTVAAKDGEVDGRLSFKPPPDGFVTLIIQPGPGGKITLTPVADAANFNQVRARISFYNAASDCVSASLLLEPGASAVFEGVASGAAKSRTVSPVRAIVRVACADGAGPSITLDTLESGGSYSLWLMNRTDAAGFFLTTDRLSQVKLKQ